jgi:gag-polypeptide of LTR copia-type
MAVGEDRVKKAGAQMLKRQFDRLVMSDTANLVGFSQLLISLVGEMRSLGMELKESTIVEKLFSAVPDKFLPIISTIEQWGDTSNMTVAEVIGRLRVFEEGLKGRQQHQEEEDEKLLLTRAQWEALTLKDKKVGEGVDSNSCSNQEKKPRKKFDKSKIKCFNCLIYGHFASECRKPRKERALIAEKEDEEEPVLLMQQVITGAEEECIETSAGQIGELHLGTQQNHVDNFWFLDSGAINHMSGSLEHFTTLDTGAHGAVKLGDGHRVHIGGRGTVLIKGRNGEHKALTNVYYIPKLTNNIISLGQLEEQWCRVEIKNGELLVFDTAGQLLIKVKRSANMLYVLNLELAKPVCLMANTESEA